MGVSMRGWVCVADREELRFIIASLILRGEQYKKEMTCELIYHLKSMETSGQKYLLLRS